MKYLKYIFGILTLIIIILVMVLIYNDKISRNSPLFYKQGVEFYNKGDYQNAYYNFGKIKWISPLYNMAIYKQAKSAQKAGDYKTAVLKYELFLEKQPNSVFEKNAKYNLAKCYFYLKEYENAKIRLEQLTDENNDFIPQKDYFLGLIEKSKDKEKAAVYFYNYLKNTQTDKDVSKDYVLLAADELASLSGISFNNDYIKTLGIAYYESKKYDEALKYFSQLPLDECWDYIVLSNHYMGNKLIAKKLIESGLRQYSKIISPENLYQIYNIFTSYMMNSKFKNWQTMYNLVEEYDLAGEDYVMYKLANLMAVDKSVFIYKELFEKYPQSKYAPESLWNIFWNSYLSGDLVKAREYALNHLKLYPNSKSTPKIMFWLGKIDLAENKISDANSILSKLSLKYPDNYYALRAESILNKKNDFFKTNKKNVIPILKNQIDFPITLSELEIKDLKLINTLFNMGDYDIWLDADFKNTIVDSWFEYKKEKKSRSMVMARDYISDSEIKPPLISEAYKLAYPLYYVEEINIAGKKLDIDQFIILSIIREESYFDENSISPTGAKGLMQLMPQTANYMASKLKMDSFEDINFENPRLNLFLGCNYVKYLYERFNNNDLYVIAAYNG